jgi:hypothetical protein
MKKLTAHRASIALAAALLLPWTIAEAVEPFQMFGIIKSVSSNGFTIRDQKYRIAPGAELKSNDPARRRLSDFRKGDEIYFEGKIIGDDYLVDFIIYKTPVPS